MKKITFLCLAVVSTVFSYAQNALAPTFYVDSQAVNLKKTYLNPDNIISMSVFKDTIGPRSNGSIYISLKKPLHEFVSLPEAVRNNLPEMAGKKVLFIISGQVIKDTANIRIDPSFAVNMHAVNLSELPFTCDDPAYTNIVIIEMGPGTPVNLQLEKRQMRIRGHVAIQ